MEQAPLVLAFPTRNPWLDFLPRGDDPATILLLKALLFLLTLLSCGAAVVLLRALVTRRPIRIRVWQAILAVVVVAFVLWAADAVHSARDAMEPVLYVLGCAAPDPRLDFLPRGDDPVTILLVKALLFAIAVTSYGLAVAFLNALMARRRIRVTVRRLMLLVAVVAFVLWGDKAVHRSRNAADEAETCRRIVADIARSPTREAPENQELSRHYQGLMEEYDRVARYPWLPMPPDPRQADYPEDVVCRRPAVWLPMPPDPRQAD